MKTRSRVLCYLFLALVCYTLAVSVSGSVILFLGIAGIAELLMWFNLFSRPKTHTEAK